MARRSRGHSRFVPALLAAVAAWLCLSGTPSLPQEPAAESEAEGQAAQTDERANRVTIAIGSMRQAVDGNPFRFRQYVTPPSATHIALLGVTHPLDEAGLTLGGYAYDLLEPGAGGVGYLYEVDQGLRFDTRYRRSQFYRGFYAGESDVRRKDWETDVRWRVTRDDHLIGHYGTVSMRGGRPGSADDHWLRETWGLKYTRTLDFLNASASYGFEQFGFTGAPSYLAGDRGTWSLRLAPSRDARTLVGAAFSASATDVERETRSPEERSVALSAVHQLTQDLAVNIDLEYWQLQDSLAQNAYAKQERLAAIEGEWAGLPRTVLRAGFETAEVDYVNGRQLQVVKPAVNTTALSLRTRPLRELKLQADFRRRRVDDRPLAYDISGQPTTTRIWAETDMLRFRGTYAPAYLPVGLTAGYRSDDRENPDQGTSNQIITRDLTAWWAIADDLTATASFLEQDFALRGAGLATPYVSDSRSWALGATWQATDRTALDASFTRADSFGSVELREDTWSVSLEHAWREHRLRLGLVLDDLDDSNGTPLGYDADLLYAEFSTELP
jgi:hypothetical protein